MNESEKDLDGVYELGKVESLDTSIMRGRVRSLTTGGISDMVVTPSPYFGVMPKVGELVSIYKRHGWMSRYVGPVSRLEQLKVEDRLVADNRKGDIPKMSPGDVFIGAKARMTFDDSGNSVWRNYQGNLSIKLNDYTSKLLVSATNYQLSTPGDGIRIVTRSSVPTTFGDTISIEKNAPLPALPEELTNFVPTTLTELSSMKIDEFGGITLSSVGGLAKLRLSSASLPTEPFTPGNIRLENPLANLNLDATGKVLLETAVGSVTVRNIACALEFNDDQSVRLGNRAASLTYATSGLVTLDSGTDMVLRASTSLSEIAASYSLTASASADITSPMITLTGTQVSIVGIPNFLGVPATIPLIGVTTVAKIPVMVNGVPIGFIPVIP